MANAWKENELDSMSSIEKEQNPSKTESSNNEFYKTSSKEHRETYFDSSRTNEKLQENIDLKKNEFHTESVSMIVSESNDMRDDHVFHTN